MNANPSKRLLSLDVLRGITVAGMILVNTPGSWSYVYAPLKHAPWIGLTPTDLVFPFFMFMMGISTYISLRKYQFRLTAEAGRKLLRRTLVLFALGFLLNLYGQAVFGEGNPLAHVRVLGVLQRFAICYGVAALLALTLKHRYLPFVAIGLLAGYFIFLVLGNGFAYGPDNILSKVDMAVLGPNHLLNDHGIDPEGVLSQLPAIAHVLIGFCCGKWLMQAPDIRQKMLRLFLVGTTLAIGGYLLSYGCPISKKAWSPTFVLVTCGMAAALLALLIEVIDVQGRVRWSRPFDTFGVNPLFLYVFSEALAITLNGITLPFGDGRASLHDIAYQAVLRPLLGDYGGSLAYALLFVFVCWAVGYVLHRKRIYIKI
ncbi:MAG: heparan-alpha-glucosaminide N-acetyltransferase domain-containing protein [Mediterranea sp.]|jgi:predicted acyltransferase|nr:heparan-alpha-glucosaminide N-acetyltransferase domain-containing protein [Mediterranea sp.]